jgi:hypothetical protein
VTADDAGPEQGEPQLIDLVRQLRTALGLPDVALPRSPKAVWEEALDEVRLRPMASGTPARGTRSARVILEVTAGVVPGTAEPEYTRRWAITTDEWEKAGQVAAADIANGQGALLAERNGQAVGYAEMMMAAPNVVNWVRTDWLWL